MFGLVETAGGGVKMNEKLFIQQMMKNRIADDVTTVIWTVSIFVLIRAGRNMDGMDIRGRSI